MTKRRRQEEEIGGSPASSNSGDSAEVAKEEDGGNGTEEEPEATASAPRRGEPKITSGRKAEAPKTSSQGTTLSTSHHPRGREEDH